MVQRTQPISSTSSTPNKRRLPLAPRRGSPLSASVQWLKQRHKVRKGIMVFLEAYCSAAVKNHSILLCKIHAPAYGIPDMENVAVASRLSMPSELPPRSSGTPQQRRRGARIFPPVHIPSSFPFSLFQHNASNLLHTYIFISQTTWMGDVDLSLVL